MTRRMTQEEFVAKAMSIHGDRYSYEQSVFVRSNVKLTVICRIHGPFQISSNNLFFGKGCPTCAKEKRGSSKSATAAATFIARATAIHKGRYGYDKVIYVAAKKPIVVTCESHGDFTTTPDKHLRGSGCQQCADMQRVAAKRHNQDDFVRLSRIKHGDRYSYEQAVYVDSAEPVEIICPEHGAFWQAPNGHTQGRGCPRCGKEAAADKLRIGTEEFTSRAKAVHNGFYDYSETCVTNLNDKVRIICPVHGLFWQQANAHARGNGCPSCAHSVSTPENEIADLFEGEGYTVIQRDRELLRVGDERYVKEIDLVIPKLKLAIEYCGVWWHCEKNRPNRRYHLDKLEQCASKGYRLLTVFEDEYIYRHEQTIALIRKIAGLDSPEIIQARKCRVADLDSSTANALFDSNHIQGKARAQHYYGLYAQDSIVACAAFSSHRVFMGGKADPDTAELVRFCAVGSRLVLGGAAKLTKHAQRQHNLNQVVSYADRRWFTGKGYLANGFSLAGTTEPNYWYVKNRRRISRYTYAKHRLAEWHAKGKLPFYDPAFSEAEIMRQNGFDRIYDCGNLKFLWA